MSKKYYVSKKRKELYGLTYTMYDFAASYEGKSDRSTFIRVARSFFEELSKEVIINRYKFRLPFRMGTVRIQKRKHKPNLNSHRVDWERTKALDKKVYHLNTHSNRHYFKWMWDRSLSRFTNVSFYYFFPVRKNRLNLAKYIKKCAGDPYKKDYDCLS